MHQVSFSSIPRLQCISQQLNAYVMIREHLLSVNVALKIIQYFIMKPYQT